MQTPHRWFGAGHSTAPDSAKAGAEAAADAVGGRSPSLVFVFCSQQPDLPAMLLAVRSEVGPDATVVGCSGFGELSGAAATSGGVSVAALGGDGFTVQSHVAHISDSGHREAGAAAAGAMAGMKSPHSALFLLCDGVSGDPHEVVRGAYSVLGAAVPMVGGFAGDEGQRRRTFQFFDETVYEDAVIGIALGSDAHLGIGIAHGWQRLDPPMIITKSSGRQILEIDDEPALDVLLRVHGMAGGTADDLFGSGSLHAIGLSRRSGEDMRLLHAGDEADRSVWGRADVPQGALCWLMTAEYPDVIAGATESCREAVEGLQGRTPLGLLAFDCGGRRAKLGADGLSDEIAAMRAVLGSTPFAGVYTAGEIARVRGALGTHHLTLVTVAVA